MSAAFYLPLIPPLFIIILHIPAHAVIRHIILITLYFINRRCIDTNTMPTIVRLVHLISLAIPTRKSDQCYTYYNYSFLKHLYQNPLL